ncbi:hypothetical protein BGY98DRAFT_1187670 [Russula aff. rugulosa BPL654]|nr:hypothetical protein BGY98DRAFT_1187670 [Russula aff. rugulosa BPL654]
MKTPSLRTQQPACRRRFFGFVAVLRLFASSRGACPPSPTVFSAQLLLRRARNSLEARSGSASPAPAPPSGSAPNSSISITLLFISSHARLASAPPSSQAPSAAEECFVVFSSATTLSCTSAPKIIDLSSIAASQSPHLQYGVYQRLYRVPRLRCVLVPLLLPWTGSHEEVRPHGRRNAGSAAFLIQVAERHFPRLVNFVVAGVAVIVIVAVAVVILSFHMVSLASCFGTFFVCTWHDRPRTMFHGDVVVSREDGWDLLRAGVCRATLSLLGQWFSYASFVDRGGVLGVLGKLPTDSPLLSCFVETTTRPDPTPHPDLRPPRALHPLHTIHPRLRPPPKPLHVPPPPTQRTPIQDPLCALAAAPATAPADERQALSAAAAAANSGGTAVPVLPPALEKILARLASSDVRTILVRYGQRVIQTCSHCVTEADYALHALPPALLSYTLAAAMLGSVTVRGSARESRRNIGLMLLVFAALVESYWAYTVPIRIPSRQKLQNGSRDETIMWHDTLWFLRHALFLALPLTIHLLPAPPSTPKLLTTLTHLSKTADAQLTHIHFLRLSTAATQRIPELRTRATAFWTRERSIGAAVRRDADVRDAAERVGLGIAPSEERSLLGSRDYAEAQKPAAGEAERRPAGREGTLHRAARGAVAALKEAVLRLPPQNGGA